MCWQSAFLLGFLIKLHSILVIMSVIHLILLTQIPLRRAAVPNWYLHLWVNWVTFRIMADFKSEESPVPGLCWGGGVDQVILQKCIPANTLWLLVYFNLANALAYITLYLSVHYVCKYLMRTLTTRKEAAPFWNSSLGVFSEIIFLLPATLLNRSSSAISCYFSPS